MSNATSTHTNANHTNVNHTNDRPRRLTTETKASTKTTEFFVYLAAVAAVAITALMVDDTVQGGGGDPFGALDALRFITFLTIGYMISRGLAKAGSRDAYDA